MANAFKNIPLTTDILSTSQGDLQTNFKYIQGALGKDHQIVFNDTDTGTSFEGRHTQLSLNNRGTNNLTFPSDGTDTFFWSNAGDLFARNSTSPAFQVTAIAFGVQAPLSATGTWFSFLPGAVLIQGGTITTSSNQADVSVTFVGLGGKSFSNFCYGVWTNMQRSGTNNVDTVYTYTFATTGFHYRNTSSANQTFNWVAVGS